MKRKELSVVDTNVPLVANGSSNASKACVLNCIHSIKKIMTEERIALDSKWKIIREYTNKLSSKGQPGVGDAFLKWVLTNQGNPQVCEIVSITPKAEDDSDFVEFPDDPLLSCFDKSDRKFVAVAVAHINKPPILQAADSKWWGWKDALAKHHIKVVFLCRKELELIFLKKHSRKI